MNDLDARHRDLLFLLGLAPLAIGCSVGVPDNGTSFTSTPYGGDATSSPATTDATEGSDVGTGGNDATSNASASGSASATVTASASASATVTASAGSSDDGSVSVSVSVSASAGDDSMTTGPVGYVCDAYGELLAACYYGGDPAAAAAYTAYCEESLAIAQGYGPACMAAFEDLIVCLSQLSCQELPSFGMPGYCDGELAVYQGTCV